jgi:hypothetical protein
LSYSLIDNRAFFIQHWCLAMKLSVCQLLNCFNYYDWSPIITITEHFSERKTDQLADRFIDISINRQGSRRKNDAHLEIFIAPGHFKFLTNKILDRLGERSEIWWYHLIVINQSTVSKDQSVLRSTVTCINKITTFKWGRTDMDVDNCEKACDFMLPE